MSAVTDFVNKYWGDAITASQSTGINPSVILAQAGLESGWGKSAPGNNFFGIKAVDGQSSQSLLTKENVDGRLVTMPQDFAVYNSPAESFQAWASTIADNFPSVAQHTGSQAQAIALGSSGYATDGNYTSKMSSVLASVQNALTSLGQNFESGIRDGNGINKAPAASSSGIGDFFSTVIGLITQPERAISIIIGLLLLFGALLMFAASNKTVQTVVKTGAKAAATVAEV